MCTKRFSQYLGTIFSCNHVEGLVLGGTEGDVARVHYCLHLTCGAPSAAAAAAADDHLLELFLDALE